MIRNVIFDFDGTVVDSVPGIQWSVEQALAACGIARPCPDLTPLIGPPIREILSAVSGTSEQDVLDRLESAFRSAYDSTGWRKTTCQPGAEDIMRVLRASGRDLWLVTNKPQHATLTILTELGMGSSFREVVCRNSRTPVFISKAEMLTNLLERRTLPRAESIMVGDTMEDCRAAAEAGIGCAVVPHGYGRGLGGTLPDGCRAIAGWDELLELCGLQDGASDLRGVWTRAQGIGERQ